MTNTSASARKLRATDQIQESAVPHLSVVQPTNGNGAQINMRTLSALTRIEIPRLEKFVKRVAPDNMAKIKAIVLAEEEGRLKDTNRILLEEYLHRKLGKLPEFSKLIRD